MAAAAHCIHSKHNDALYAIYVAENKLFGVQQKLKWGDRELVSIEAFTKLINELQAAILAYNTSKKAYEVIHAEYRADVCRNVDMFNASCMKISIEEYKTIIKPIKNELVAQAQKLIQLYRDGGTQDNINKAKYTFKGMLKGKSKYIDNKILYYAHNGIDTMNEQKLETFIQRISY